MNLQNQLNWLPSLLDGVVVPAPLNAELVKSQIMLECGLLTPIYSEPYLMKDAITQWFSVHAWTFDHLVKIIQAEYSPIENVDRYDSTTTSTKGSEFSSESESTGNTRNMSSGATMAGSSGEDRSRAEQIDGTENRQRNETRSGEDVTDRERSEETEKATGQETRTNGNNENTVSAFNASTYQPLNSDLSIESESIFGSESATSYTSESENVSRSESISESENITRSDSTSESENISRSESESSSATESENIVGSRVNNGLSNRDEITVFSQHLHGNIGVTTNQQMINEELDLLERFNVYGWIAKTFRADLIIDVY